MRKAYYPVILIIAACGNFKFGSICLPTDTTSNSRVPGAEVVATNDNAASSGTSSSAGNSDGSGSQQGSGGSNTGNSSSSAASGPMFVLKAGLTTTKPWNTVSTPLVVKVGDTVTFKNSDSVAHIMHGGVNCPMDHWSTNQPLQPGASISFKVLRAFDPGATATTSPCYEHTGASNESNSPAPFFVKATL